MPRNCLIRTNAPLLECVIHWSWRLWRFSPFFFGGMRLLAADHQPSGKFDPSGAVDYLTLQLRHSISLLSTNPGSL